MIGIVILGLGLVMVATIFPVAWTRARVLSEYTVQRSVDAMAHDAVRSITRVSTPQVRASSFLGDLTLDPQDVTNPADDLPIGACQGFSTLATPVDDWVHALNLENVKLATLSSPPCFVNEDPWRLEDPAPAYPMATAYDEIRLNVPDSPVVDRSFFTTQLSLPQRLYPVLSPRPDVDANRCFGDTTAGRQWDLDLQSRRYAWAVLHRLQRPVRATVEALSSVRTFDLYYVLLRRGQSTDRFARQDPLSSPSPCDFAETPVRVPAADAPEQDLMFPVPWRVKVQFPDTLGVRVDPLTLASNATGIPTEIVVPPPSASSADPAAKRTWVGLFPPGAQFIDEVTGLAFRVSKRRLNATGDSAVLTLDREVFLEDVDLPAGDPRCDLCAPYLPALPKADPAELLRTVWVFPPPVEQRASSNDPLLFVGSQPVVSIDVRTLTVGPAH
jgi:hypothetical protein